MNDRQPDSKLNFGPVIGILSHPSDGASGRLNSSPNTSYIAASYVKFVESAGARVIPLIYNEPPHILQNKLNLVNGVLLTGGWAKTGLYFEVVEEIFKDMNDKQPMIPDECSTNRRPNSPVMAHTTIDSDSDPSEDSLPGSCSRTSTPVHPSMPSPPLYRCTARMRTGPYCPMPSGIVLTSGAGPSRLPPRQAMDRPEGPCAHPTIDRFTIGLDDIPPRVSAPPPPLAPTPLSERRGLSPGEMRGIKNMALDLRALTHRSIEHSACLQDLFMDNLQTRIIAERTAQLFQYLLYVCCLLVIALVLVCMRLF